MIKINTKEVVEIYFGSEPVAEVYFGPTLVWMAVRSCFGSGIWIQKKPWLGKELWKNKK